MSIITKMRRQKAIWWKAESKDGYGKRFFSFPSEISCRWEDVTEQMTNREGRTIVSRSIVYVDREVSEGDRLKKGTLLELSDLTNLPEEIEGAYEVIKFSALPNLKATENLLTAWL